MSPGVVRFPSYSAVAQAEPSAVEDLVEMRKPVEISRVDMLRREIPARKHSGSGGYWESMWWTMLQVFIAETVGTAMLMFFGCMGQVRWDPHNDLPPMQAAIVFSVVVATIVQIFGHISAAHLNPAVTIAFTLLGQVTPSMALVYILSEGAGAFLGYGLLMALTPVKMLRLSAPPGLCCTVPHQGLTDLQALVMEFLATCFLVLVVCACSDIRNSQNTDSTPLKFGATIMALSVAVGPYTGASMNPVRSLAPAFWNGTWTGHWIYWLGPCLAGVTATLFYQAIFDRPAVDFMETLEDAPLNRITVVTSEKKLYKGSN